MESKLSGLDEASVGMLENQLEKNMENATDMGLNRIFWGEMENLNDYTELIVKSI